MQVTIFGGSGFIGKNIARYLIEKIQNVRINIITRNIENAKDLKLIGSVGQINLIEGHIEIPYIEKYVKYSDVVINLIGIKYAKTKQDFFNAQSKTPEKIAKLIVKHNIPKFIHFSALGIEHNISSYAKSKIIGENAILEICPNAFILRPSLVFGIDDNFFNLLAKLINISPVIPLFNKGETLFQPVYVKNVVEFIHHIIEQDEIADQNIYELAGLEVYSFKEIVEFIVKIKNKKRLLIPTSLWTSNCIARMLEAKITRILLRPFIGNLMPIITQDHIKALKINSTINTKHNILLECKIIPSSIKEIIPTYI